MRYYFAPLEGLTDHIFRQTHHKHFPGVHRYYTPFFSPTVHRSLTAREARELPPSDSLGYKVVPQLLTKVADDFIWMHQQCADLGYSEVNLNLGCPSGTVTAKGKGSGMLIDTDALDRFLDTVFHQAVVDISVKTRIGFQAPEEFPQLLEIFNQYPIKELTVHPRVRNTFYSGHVDLDVFTYCLKNSKNPVCYNGDLRSLSDISECIKRFPTLDAVMLGRGLIADPGMLTPGGTTVQKLEAFHEELLSQYLHAFGGSRNAMFRLKEHWGMLINRFEGSEKLWKEIRKTTDLQQFVQLTKQVFHTLPLIR